MRGERLTNEEFKELSRLFKKAWELNVQKVENKESDFGKAIIQIIDQMFRKWNQFAEEESPAYDFQIKLDDIKEVIEQYQDIFHIVRVTVGWEDED